MIEFYKEELWSKNRLTSKWKYVARTDNYDYADIYSDDTPENRNEFLWMAREHFRRENNV